MRRLIQALTSKLKSLSDDEVIRLSRAVEFERLDAAASDHWFAVLSALRPRLSFLRPKRAPSISRQFFQPVADLLVDGRTGDKRLGEIDRASLAPIWTWLLKSDAGAAIQIAKSQLRNNGPDASNVQTELALLPVRHAALQAMHKAVKDSEAQVGVEASLASILGDSRVVGDFREIALSMTVAEPLIHLQSNLPDSLDIVTTQHIELAREYFQLIEAVNPDLSYLIPTIFFRRLAQPWEVLRLTAAVGGASAEKILLRPDFQIVFNFLVEILRGEQQAFDETEDDNVQKLLSHLTTFSEVYMGISETVSLHKKGKLGSILLDCRNDFSDRISARVRSVSQLLCDTVPLDYSKISSSLEPLPPQRLAEVSAKVSTMADFIGQVSRLSCMTDLYFGIDKDVKLLNDELDKRLVALTQAYRQKLSLPPEVLNQQFEILAPAVRRLSGSDAEEKLATVRV